MQPDISPVALQMIERALGPIVVISGREIQRLQLIVSHESRLTQIEHIETVYGRLRVKASPMVPKGYSYLLEELGKPGRAFSWVSKPRRSS